MSFLLNPNFHQRHEKATAAVLSLPEAHPSAIGQYHRQLFNYHQRLANEMKLSDAQTHEILMYQEYEDFDTFSTDAGQESADIYHAANCGDARAIKEHIENGVDINARHWASGYTPLHYAAKGGHLEAVATLLDNGADINKQSRQGLSAIHFASSCPPERYGDPVQVVKLLIAKGARLDVFDHKGYTPLHHAVYGGQYHRVIEMLLKYGVDFDATRVLENLPTTLQLALYVGNQYVIDLLVITKDHLLK